MIASKKKITLTIKLERYLQDYIRYISNIEYRRPDDLVLFAQKGSYLGKLVSPFIEYRPDIIPVIDRFNDDSFTFEVPQVHFRDFRGNIYISEANQDHIKKIVEAHFRLHFRFYADDKVRYLRDIHTPKGAIKKVIHQFCSDTNLTCDHVTYETISKSYYRARKKSNALNQRTNKTAMLGHLFFII
jgi:hypothetical protein